jgi:nitroimidazol reductase NimA-like FMN-containing flavoprotein (pyridoxamine 5'-phosphate oxidase superfamily)
MAPAEEEAFGTPRAERPGMPEGYGISTGEEGILPWSWAEERLEASHNYWIVTASPEGRPHAMPVWGVWSGGALFFATSRASRKGRNLAANPRLVVHLESGDEAVILEGRAEDLRDSAAYAEADAAYARKYPNPEAGEGFHLPAEPEDDAVFRLRPRTVQGWRERDFPQSATRWRFDR